MESQGYYIKQNIVFQYNHSDIEMEKNGNKFCTSNSRHIDVQFFYEVTVVEVII